MLDERQLPILNGTNFRDLGGYPTQSGYLLKWCKLIRSGDLSQITAHDQQVLADYGVTTIIDLRSSVEIQQSQDRVPEHMKWFSMPVLDDDATESTETINQLKSLYSLSPRGGYLRMLNAYAQLIMSNQAQMTYTRFFQYLLTYGDKETVLFHCTAGKDRTGILSVLLLTILGVDLDVIREDYLLTNKYAQRRAGQRVLAAKNAKMNTNFLTSIRDLSLVSADYLTRALDLIDFEYGGPSEYLHNELGLSSDDFHVLQSIYLS